jgi:protein BCP1
MPSTAPQVAAVQVSSIKRKSAPKEDEDDSGSEAGSDVVRFRIGRCVFKLTDTQSMIDVDFDFFNLNPDVDQWVLPLSRRARG